MSVIKNLKFKLDSFELSIPEWEIPDKGLSILTGESGSGKSTLLDILVGFRKCKGMSWNFLGIDYSNIKIEDKKIGLVLQKGELFPHLNVRQCIKFAALARDNKNYLTESESFLKELKLDKEILLQKTPTLSGGEKQRVALLCALIGRPKILLLDEAFSALDIENKESALGLVNRFCLTNNIPALLVTHDVSLISRFNSHFKLQDGSIV